MRTRPSRVRCSRSRRDGQAHALGQVPTWGFTDAKFQAAWSEPGSSTGTGVRVAILDTGVDATFYSPDLVGHFVASPGADIINAVNPNNPTQGVTSDPNGHGTHVAGILAANNNTQGVVGGAPGVTIVPVRVLNSSGSGAYSVVAAGILWAADRSKGNASVISMSLGGPDDGGLVGAALATVEDPANPQYTHPVVVIAAGNTGCAMPSFPAAYAGTNPYQPVSTHAGLRQVLAVSALCKPGITGSCPTASPFPADPFKLAVYSSLAWNGSGAPTGITAPGTDINSTLPWGSYGVKSGTSMATPFVAAAAALVVAHCPADTSTQVVTRLETAARDLGPAGPDKLYGFGMVDADNAVKGC